MCNKLTRLELQSLLESETLGHEGTHLCRQQQARQVSSSVLLLALGQRTLTSAWTDPDLTLSPSPALAGNGAL
jgi:hypothetical protein